MHCRDHAVQLHRAREQFAEAGVDLILIGQASPRHAEHFRRRLELDLPVLADGERASYRAAGAKRATAGELLGPKVVAKGLKATGRSGVRQGKVIGDAAQLGGAVVVRPDGSIAWAHMAQDASDNVAPDELLAAARAR